jgi:hypothetical protein
MYCRRKAVKLLSEAHQAEHLIVRFCSKLPASPKERDESRETA